MSLDDAVLELESEAATALLQAKAIEFCYAHSDVWVRVGDPDRERHAYAILTSRWKSGALSCSREDLMDAIKDMLDWAADDKCPECGAIADA